MELDKGLIGRFFCIYLFKWKLCIVLLMGGTAARETLQLAVFWMCRSRGRDTSVRLPPGRLR